MRVLDIGSGPTPKLISNYLEIEVVPFDKQINPSHDMEHLPYPDDWFDVVICINALDHTKDAEQALREFVRVARGTVYINCALDQKTRHRKKHYWDAKEDGTFTNGTDSFDLKDYGFEIQCIDGRMIARW
jgi:hypothetical protein